MKSLLLSNKMYRSDPCYSKDMKIAILQTKVYDSFDFHIRIGKFIEYIKISRCSNSLKISIIYRLVPWRTSGKL